MPEVFYVATLVMCLHGECTKFESATYSRDQLNSLIDLAEKGTSELFDIQRAARH